MTFNIIIRTLELIGTCTCTRKRHIMNFELYPPRSHGDVDNGNTDWKQTLQ